MDGPRRAPFGTGSYMYQPSVKSINKTVTVSTEVMANNEIKMAVTKPRDRNKSGLLKKAPKRT